MKPIASVSRHKSYKIEIIVSILACLILIGPTLVSVINLSIRSVITLPYKLDTIALYVIYGFLALFSLKAIVHRSLKQPAVFLIPFFLLMYFGATIFFNPHSTNLLMRLGIESLLTSLPYIFLGVSISDFDKLKRLLYISGYVALVSVIVIFLFYEILSFEFQRYSQYYSYVLLFPSVVFFSDAVNNRKLIGFFAFIFSLFFMISMGARGPLVCLFLYILTQLIVHRKTKYSVFVLLLSSILFSVIAFLLLEPEFYRHLIILFDNIGVSTRLLTSIANKSLFIDYSRIALLKASFEIIERFPVFGIGIGMDRIMLSYLFVGTTNTYDILGWYPHNIFIELLLHYGIFVGGGFIVFLLFKFLSLFSKSKSRPIREITLILYAVSIFPLFFSGSYLSSSTFFFLVGILLNQRQKSITIS